VINTGWKHLRMDDSGASAPRSTTTSWASVTLPHTWNATDGQDGGNNYYRGIGWYRRHYTPPASAAGKRIFLQFDGANIVAVVYVNGTMVGTHRGGFARFRFDVTRDDPGSDNVIAVHGVERRRRRRRAADADFTFFGGLYRDVHVLITDTVPRRRAGLRLVGVYVSPTNVSATTATLDRSCASATIRPPRQRSPSIRSSCARTDRSRRACRRRATSRRARRRCCPRRRVPEPAPVERRRGSLRLHRLRRGPRGRRGDGRRVGAARLSLLLRRRRAGLLAERPVPGSCTA
jgi:hypothetical protein